LENWLDRAGLAEFFFQNLINERIQQALREGDWAET
jgi:hypothetical protein